MTEIFSDLPHAVANTVAVANDIEFTLENLGYEFPKFPVPQGETMDSFLDKVVWEGARQRYDKISERVRSQIEHELALIRKLEFSGYFLIVWDLVRYCRESDIMVQGRGSETAALTAEELDKAGNVEFRTWITLLGAVGDARARVVCYEPSWHHGNAVVTWPVA